MRARRAAIEAIGLIGASLVLATVSNAVASGKRHLKWIGEWTTGVSESGPVAATGPDTGPDPGSSPAPAAGTAAAATPARPEFEIGTDQAIAEHQAGALFLDARRSEAYAEGHIPGARAFPVWESTTDDKIVELLAEFPPETTRVVTYCTGGRCEDSHLLRGKLQAAGYQQVLVYHDGMPGWEQAGQPVEK